MSAPDDTPAESGWLFRRIFAYGSTLLSFALLAAVLFRVVQWPLATVLLGLLVYMLAVALLYLGGASAAEIAKITAAAAKHRKDAP